MKTFSTYQLEFNGWSQLQISIDYGRIVQTEHHWIEDFLIYKTKRQVQLSRFSDTQPINKSSK